ncbi:hypothetical protein TrVFT333_006172 [Trichoderma virens FT-333]|nr:hypothetical protein TrVFT333_006172 [Trichoderma virens FT-333]
MSGSSRPSTLNSPTLDSDLEKHLLPITSHPSSHQSESQHVSKSETVVVFPFRTLQLQRIAELQDKLLEISGLNLKTVTADEKEAIDMTLTRYAQAIRDYDTLSENTLFTIPSNATFVGALGGMVPPHGGIHFKSTIASLLKSTDTIRAAWFTAGVDDAYARLSPDKRNIHLPISNLIGNIGVRELGQEGQIRRAQQKAFTARLVFALLGGVALIGPVLIMTLHTSTSTNLITISIATFIFLRLM